MNFTSRLKELGYGNYDAYLRSSHWSEFKARYRASGRGVTCAVCGEPRVHFHHHTYDRLGSEELDDVTPLCESHHDQVHAWLLAEKARVERTADAIELLKAGNAFDTTSLMKGRQRRKEKAQKKQTPTAAAPAGKGKKGKKKAKRLLKEAEHAAVLTMPSCNKHVVEMARILWSLRERCSDSYLRSKCFRVIRSSDLRSINRLIRDLSLSLGISPNQTAVVFQSKPAPPPKAKKKPELSSGAQRDQEKVQRARAARAAREKAHAELMKDVLKLPPPTPSVIGPLRRTLILQSPEERRDRMRRLRAGK